MKYILLILIVIIGICIYYIYKTKIANKKSNLKENKMNLINKNSSSNDITIKVEELPIETVENYESMFEITDNKILGQANLTITEFTKKDDLDYKKYNEELTEIHNWYIYQKILLEMLYRIADLKNILYIGAISKEQLNIIPETYTKQVMEVHKLLTQWHKKIIKKLGIDTETSRRKRMGFDGAVHWIPGLFKDDFNFCSISETTNTMIKEQTSNCDVVALDSKDNIFDKDVKIILRDGKVYYLPQ